MRRAAVTLIAVAILIGPATAAAASNGPRAGTRTEERTVTAVAARPQSAALPTVSGSYGQTPTISFPSSKPPTTLVSKVLERGHGSTVRSGDLIAVNYTGQIWRGKVFDSSFLAKFNHQAPFATAIGIGQVVKGWDDGIPGATVGSRVLLVIPPKWGYGSKGASGAGITGTDTIVFVVDILGAWGKDASAGAGATQVAGSHGGVTVSGPLDAQPTVHIASSAPKPTAQSVTLLDRGTGPKVHGGLLVYQEYVKSWTGSVPYSTWEQGRPTSDTVSSSSSTSSDPFVNMPVGSRVLFEEPKGSNGGPYAIVVDLVADLTAR